MQTEPFAESEVVQPMSVLRSILPIDGIRQRRYRIVPQDKALGKRIFIYSPHSHLNKSEDIAHFQRTYILTPLQR